MFRLHIIQALYGDCFLLEYGQPGSPRYILVDGGPPTVYERSLRGALQRIAGGKLDLALVSHVDNDHIIGLRDMLAEMRQQRANGQPQTVTIEQIWHNSFSQTIGAGNDIAARLNTLMQAAGRQGAAVMLAADSAVQGIAEGNQLRRDAALLGIPLNPNFVDGLITPENAPGPIQMENITVRVVGPTRQNLERLREEWLAWLNKHADDIASGDPVLAAMADQSIPNLSSIALLVEGEGKTLLLTGDGRGDHLLQGLAQAGLLDGKGRIHVDVLKLPHHGSNRNVNRAFFKDVTADTYIISADGRYGNPDLATCAWLVEAARRQKRRPRIIMTNETPTSRKLLEEYPPSAYGYRLDVMPRDAHVFAVDLAGV